MMREILGRAPVIPVLTLTDVAQAVPVAEALVAAGLPVLEVTLRTPAGLACIAAMRRAVPNAIVGAGTVLDAAQLRTAADAGSQFIVSPGFSVALAAAARHAEVPLLPGAATPTEVMAALAEGLETLKFFPAQQAGGVALLGALAAPFAQVRFCPTGGITLANARDYLALPNVLCVGMSSLVTPGRLASEDWEGIRAQATEAASLRSR